MGLHVRFMALGRYYWPWAQERTGAVGSEQTRGIVAVDEEGPIGAMVFDGWTETACQAHIVIENPMVLRHGFLEEGFDYIYNVCRRHIIIGVTPGDNEKALKFNRHLGFVELYRVRDGYKMGVDYVIQELRKEDCRWLRNVQKNVA